MILVENTYYHISKAEYIDAFLHQCKIQFGYEKRSTTHDEAIHYMETSYFRPSGNLIFMGWVPFNEVVEFVTDCDVDFV